MAKVATRKTPAASSKPVPAAAPVKSSPAAAPAANGSSSDEAKAREPLPPSLVQALPVAKMIIGKLTSLTSEIAQLERELNAARLMGAIPMARAFVVLHRMVEKIDNDLKPIFRTFEEYKTQHLPKVYEDSGVTSLPLAEGYRVGVAQTLRASIRKDQKDAAYQWLRENGLDDLITSTVNASSLSSTARIMLEEDNKELPTDIFNVALMATTSVTKT